MSRIDLNLIDNDIEKELEILWEFMPEEYFNEIALELIKHGIFQTHSKYHVGDLIEYGVKI